MLAGNQTYAATSFNGNFKLTADILKKTMREMEWLSYEVAPEWSKFCSFGPDDIGSVWEDIGAIRKRPKFNMLAVSDSMMKEMNPRVEDKILNSNADIPGFIFGIPVVHSPYLNEEIIAYNTTNPPQEIRLKLEEQRERIWNNFLREWP